MEVVIVLGNRINDDGSLTSIMVDRLELTKKYYNKYHPDKIIVSGGIANKKINFSEASAMKRWLVSANLNENAIIEEGSSMTTVENAKFSIPIAKSLGATKITVITSFDHYLYSYINVVEAFGNEINDDNIELTFYTNTKRPCELK